MDIDLSLPPKSEEILESNRGSGRNLAEKITRTGFGYGSASIAIALSAMGSVESGEVKGDRMDGTKKGPGFLGPLKMTDGSGKTMTELDIGVHPSDLGLPPGPDGYIDDILIPSIVPTLTKTEINHLRSGGRVTPEIIKKAVEHAKKRIADGKSPFKERIPPTEVVNDKLLKKIRSEEGMKLDPYRLGKEKYYTIGAGHYLDGSPGSRKLIATILPKVKYKDIQEGRVSITKAQAEQLLVLDIKERRKQTIKVLEGGKYKWEELPQDLQNHLIDATFRGSFIPMKNAEGKQIGSPDTIEFIKQGKFREAAKEFVDRGDYRKAKKTGVNRGIIKRMDAIHDALIRAAEYFEKQGA